MVDGLRFWKTEHGFSASGFPLNRENERIPRSLTSTSSIRPEPFGSELKADLLMAEGSRVAAGLASVSENGKFPYG
jgi:hypothetical protein